jgi:hypothetical protein
MSMAPSSREEVEEVRAFVEALAALWGRLNVDIPLPQ